MKRLLILQLRSMIKAGSGPVHIVRKLHFAFFISSLPAANAKLVYAERILTKQSSLIRRFVDRAFRIEFLKADLLYKGAELSETLEFLECAQVECSDRYCATRQWNVFYLPFLPFAVALALASA